MHLEFELGPVDCRLVSPDDPAAHRLVDKLLAIPDPGADRINAFKLKLWDGLIHFYDRDVSAFPAGLLHRLKMRLEKRGHTFVIRPSHQVPAIPPIPPDYLVGIDMRDYQVEAANTALELQRGLLWLATNAGKTEIMSALVGRLVRDAGISCLIIVPNANLLMQTAARVQKRLGTDVRVGRVGDGLRELDVDVLVGTYQSLAPAIPDSRGRTDEPGVAKFIQQCRAVFVDETHHAPSSSIRAILRFCENAVYRIGLTGTVDKSDKRVSSDASAIEHRWRLESYLGPVLYRVSNEFLIERGYSARPRIIVVSDRACFGPTVVTPRPSPNKAKAVNPYNHVFRLAAIEDVTWCRSIAALAKTLLDNERPPFVFSHSVLHTRKIAAQFDALGVPYVALDGTNDTGERMAALAKFSKFKDFAIITSPIFDEGADVPDIRACILAGARKSCIELLQRVGRGVRKKEEDNTVLIVDFDPVHSTMLHDHFTARLATYKDEGFKVTTLSDMMQFDAMFSPK